jgi:hypothetical protein
MVTPTRRTTVGLCAAAAILMSVSGTGLIAETAPPAPDLGPGSLSGGLCNSPETPVRTNSAGLVMNVSEMAQHKSWQPPGGEVQFTIHSIDVIPANAQVLVCFRWARQDNRQNVYLPTRPSRLDLSEKGRTLEVVATVPARLGDPPARFSDEGIYAGLWLVPLADVRILVFAKDAAAAAATFAADVRATIGVTNPFWGAMLALASIFAAFTMLSIIGHRRLRRAGIRHVDPVIRIIATRDGHASLSRLQMIVWTVVVATSAIYVMALSGELLHVTAGTLALLGISGVVSVGTELHSKLRDAVAAGPVPPRQPRWSDLVLSKDDQQPAIDITRVQMLYFTLIVAVFLGLRVAMTYVIPEIPQGFQILMGLSGVVYMGGKLARPAATACGAPRPRRLT